MLKGIKSNLDEKIYDENLSLGLYLLPEAYLALNSTTVFMLLHIVCTKNIIKPYHN